MKLCEEWLERISRKMDGELPAEEAALLESHLAGCPSCREAERELREDERRVVAALSRAVESVSLPNLAAAVLARVRSERRETERGNGGGGPARWGVRFACMVGFFGAAAAALLALVRGPDQPPVEHEAASEPVALVPTSDPTAEPAMGLGIGLVDPPAGKIPADELAALANETEAGFAYIVNGQGAADLSSVQVAIDRNDWIGRVEWLQGLPPGSWGNSEIAHEIANLGKNLQLVRDATANSDESLATVQSAIAWNGAFQSCDNLRIAVGYGSNYVRVTRNLEESLPVEAKPEARLFLSTYDSLAAGDPQGALASCDRILAEHPQSPWVDDALFKKGQIYEYHLGDYAKASEAYLALLACDPEGYRANDGQMNQARNNLRQGNWGAGLGQYRAVQNQVLATQQDANSNRLYQLATARIGFLESNMSDPVALGLYLDAEASLERGDRDAAIARIEELLAKHPQAPIRDEALYLKGEALRREGKPGEASQTWQSCIDEIPGSLGAQNAEGALLRMEAELEDAALGK
ncbi:MAG: zf-HC2 domain-containing protein [Planctomycetes bacterium]|nr:zf-HC2 domain-containing protein [Planctomycetota bacterium]